MPAECIIKHLKKNYTIQALEADINTQKSNLLDRLIFKTSESSQEENRKWLNSQNLLARLNLTAVKTYASLKGRNFH